MVKHNQFIVRNDMPRVVVLNIEPEGAIFPLAGKDQVTVFDDFTSAPVTIKLTTSDAGDSILSIWPGDGEVRVEKDGVDLLDLAQNDVSVFPSSASQQPGITHLSTHVAK
jgi:hypothetical protein